MSMSVYQLRCFVRRVRCDGSSLDSVLKIIPEVRGRRPGRVFAESGQYTGRSAWPAPLTAGSQLSLLAVGQHMASTGLTKPRLTNRVLWLIIKGC